ncbi:hypothetical protein OQA88_3720 [Cercophora sp. LCS_1]
MESITEVLSPDEFGLLQRYRKSDSITEVLSLDEYKFLQRYRKFAADYMEFTRSTTKVTGIWPPRSEYEERAYLLQRTEQHWKDNFGRLTNQKQSSWVALNDVSACAVLLMDLEKLRNAVGDRDEMDELIRRLLVLPVCMKKFVTSTPTTEDKTYRSMAEGMAGGQSTRLGKRKSAVDMAGLGGSGSAVEQGMDVEQGRGQK